MLLSFHDNDRLENISPSDVGGKAYNLFRLQQLKIQVPDFLVLPCAVVSQFLTEKGIIKLLQSSNQSDAALMELGTKLQQAISDLKLDAEMLTAIKLELTTFFGESYQISIRSSASVEDNEKDSFAGQFDTFLNVEENEVEEKLLQCIASLYQITIS